VKFSFSDSHKQIIEKGLWSQNQALVALLGLCPLLAVSNSAVNSLGLGIATTVTMALSGGVIAALRRIIPNETRLPIFVLIIAANVTIVDLLMKAYFFEMHRKIGIFIPLIVTNCAIMGRAEAFSSRNTPALSILDGISMGFGFSLVLLVLGMAREAIGTGKLFNHADLLFGDMAKNWTLHLLSDYEGFLLAVLPPGAFIGLGFILALKNLIDDKAGSKNGKGWSGQERRL
jgi:electron transport complex protein RnfE